VDQQPAGGGRHARHPGSRAGRRPWLRPILTGVVVVAVLTCGAGVYVYQRLNHNIRQASLYAGTTGDAGTEKPDPFGRVPINLLIIGSDTRSKKVDCRLGGGCDRADRADGNTGENADVEMVVHVSADRSNVTVMSVPRDTVADLPGCTDRVRGEQVAPRYGQINSTLSYGPGCTVAAVHRLTGIPIDHFVMVDFAGVIAMSDSVGGVSVCVSTDVYDPYSHLKLSAGTHTLKGLAALEFVRSRHAFGDGSDLGRTYAQHVFLSAVIRSLKRKGVLLNPAAVFALAQAATKALTVDPSLGSIPKLLGLASDLGKVPVDRVTFTTMQTSEDPTDPNRVVVTPAARALFATIINDQPLTFSDRAAATPTSTPASTPSSVGAAPDSTTATTSAQAGTRASRRRAALDQAHAQTAKSSACVPVSSQRTVTVNGVPMTPTRAFSESPRVRISAR
jgi:LCP family protein required for cell wall assembly